MNGFFSFLDKPLFVNTVNMINETQVSTKNTFSDLCTASR